MEKLKKLFAKIKSIANIELYAALGLALAVIIIVWFSSGQKNSEKNSADNSYIGQMEHKICSVVEKIDGCGKASVAISYASDAETVYAYESETTASGGVIKKNDSPVFSKGEPLVSTTLPPKILGVVVVAEGADDPIVRYKIVNVVITLLDVRQQDVQVLKYKS